VILFMKFSASKLKDLKIEARFNSLSDAEWRTDKLPIPRFWGTAKHQLLHKLFVTDNTHLGCTQAL
jgi:hypothetical protein